jgi:two-component system CheB/CheR fusion protein
MESTKSNTDLLSEINNLRLQLEEANETIEAIRTGQIDALVVHGKKGHELYTLKTADQIYRVFIEKMADGAVTLSRDGIILYSNSQFASMMKMPLSKVISSPLLSFVSPDCLEVFNALLERGWKEDCKGEVVLKGIDRLVEFQLSLTTLQLDEGVSLSIILTDLTDQKETQRQLKLNNEKLEEINNALKASNHDLNQFAFAASHDLQEPLRKILIFSNLLKKKNFEKLSEESKKYLEKIMGSSLRMKGLIDDILNYSKISEEKDVLEVIDLNELVEDVIDDFEIMIQDKKASVTVGVLPCIEANPGPIRQVFQNLINNALKFSKINESPVITITAKNISANSFNSPEQVNGLYCSICIKDNGIGFDEKYEKDVFNLFQRLHTKDQYEGSGIGLAITKRIIEKHSGQITVRSKEGKGSEFIILLPVQRPNAAIRN